MGASSGLASASALCAPFPIAPLNEADQARLKKLVHDLAHTKGADLKALVDLSPVEQAFCASTPEWNVLVVAMAVSALAGNMNFSRGQLRALNWFRKSPPAEDKPKKKDDDVIEIEAEG